MSELKDIVIALETEAKQRTDYVLDNAAEAIKNLRNERDEARREVCECKVHQQHDPMQFAQDRGWDCFKEDQP